MFKVTIPEITADELKRRYKQIKPVITVNGKLYYLREFTFEELSGTSYIWSSEKDVREDGDKLQPFDINYRPSDFSCLHRYGYYGLFKPSIAEVLAQIKEDELFSFIRAFEIIDFPKTAEDFYKDDLTRIMFENGYHVSTVRLYQEKLKQ